jgi:hypothetical protein
LANDAASSVSSLLGFESRRSWPLDWPLGIAHSAADSLLEQRCALQNTQEIEFLRHDVPVQPPVGV